jgi:gamma-glutamylcyclotransferase (GGCT)/AIG2-like uncharacterized protein YtfP
MTAPGRINLFVYGTLRRGQYNDRGLTDLALDIVRNVVVDGAMFNVQGQLPIYPVVDFDQPGTVHGDILVGLPLGDDIVEGVMLMERGAGYEAREVQTHVLTDGPVIGFHQDSTRGGLGVRITDGDWLRFDMTAQPSPWPWNRR